MKLLNVMAKLGMVAFVALTLTACGKKKNGSTASTPTSQCTFNGTGWYNRNGVACTPNNGSNICPSNGQYVNYQGQIQSCTPGQVITTGYTNPQYPTNPQVQGCGQYYYQYGVPYVPVNYYGTYLCVRYDLMYNYNPGYGYYDYYDYPAYTGSSCGTQINFGGDWGYVGVCW